jgi:hypothetical protein
MPEVWGRVAGEVGLGADAPARRVAALHGMVIAPGASDVVELRGRVLCFPHGTGERALRFAVARWVLSASTRDPAQSYVDLVVADSSGDWG